MWIRYRCLWESLSVLIGTETACEQALHLGDRSIVKSTYARERAICRSLSRHASLAYWWTACSQPSEWIFEYSSSINKLCCEFSVLLQTLQKRHTLESKKSSKIMLHLKLLSLATSLLLSAAVGHQTNIRAVPGLSTCASRRKPSGNVTCSRIQTYLGLQITKIARKKAIALWQ